MYILDVLFILLVVMTGYEYNVIIKNRAQKETCAVGMCFYCFLFGQEEAEPCDCKRGVISLHTLVCVNTAEFMFVFPTDRL